MPPATEPALCQDCSSGIFGPASWRKMWAVGNEQEEFHLACFRPNVEYLASVDAKCWFCSTILHRLDNRYPGRVRKLLDGSELQECTVSISLTLNSIPHHTSPSKTSSALVRVTVSGESPINGPFISFNVGLTTTLGDAAAAVFLVPRPIDGKHLNFDPQIAIEWLRHCQTKHAQCAYNSSPRLPNRVIDCAKLQKDSQICLNASTREQHAEYAALSYVWGGPQPSKTTRFNIAQRLNGIALASLPKTMRDAVEVTRALGLRYLWIDAICIIQDKTEDVVEELGRMRDYYQNAFCVIAASRAGVATDGFLDVVADTVLFHNSRDESGDKENDRREDVKPFEIPFFGRNAEKGLLIFEVDPRRYSPENDPLSKRAWVLQEHLLCPRVLRFPSAQGFVMQCEKKEQFAGKIYYAKYQHNRLLQPSTVGLDFSRADPTTNDFHDSWSNIVTTYGQMHLTDPKDKLTAVASLAEEYSQRSSNLGRYLAGHWEAYLVESLPWKVDQVRRRPQEYRAPSWSWASVDNVNLRRSSNIGSEIQKEYHILSCQVTPAHILLPFGAVIGGYLHVRARLQKLPCLGSGYGGRGYKVSAKHDRQHVLFTDPDASDDTLEPEEFVYLMCLRSYFGASKEMGRYFEILALKNCATDRFRRIGIIPFADTSTYDPLATEETEFYID